MKKSGKKSNSQGVVQNAPLVTALATPTKRQPSRASLQAIVTPEHSDNSAPVTFDSDEPPQSPSQNRLDKITPPRKHGSDATSPISSIKKEFGSKAAASANEHTTPTRKTNSRLHFEEKSSVAVVSPAPANRSTVSVSKNVEAVYKIIRKATGALGGNGHTGAIYGELTMISMQKVLNFLVSECELDENSRLIDVGCGLGKPNFHAAQSPGVRLSIGVELEELRYKLAIHNLYNFLREAGSDSVKDTKQHRSKGKSAKVLKSPSENDNVNDRGPVVSPESSTASVNKAEVRHPNREKDLRGGVNFICSDIDVATSLDPFTHIYQFDLGFEPDLQKSIAKKFNSSVHAKFLVSYRPPHRVIDVYGYAVKEIGSMMTSMHGSGEGHTAYFYQRVNERPVRPLPSSNSLEVFLPKRDQQDEQVVYCDKLFADAVRMAAGPMEELKAAVFRVYQQNLTSARPVRERKPSKKALFV